MSPEPIDVSVPPAYDPAIASRTAPSRQDRRKAATRRKLVDATRRVVAEKGIESATIAHITEAADVGFGTFYVHFGSKDEALEAVVAELVEHVGGALDRLTADMTDPAEVMAVSVRHVVGRVEQDEAWAWAVCRLGVADRLFATVLGGRMLRDLERGARSGRFDADLHPVAPFVIGGIVQAAMRARLEGLVDAATPGAVAEQILRVLGLTRRDAKRIASKPLPELPDD